MRLTCCLALRTISLLIFILHLFLHGALLALFIVLMTDPEKHFTRVMETIDTKDHRLENSEFYQTVSQYAVPDHREYLALPVTASLVLIMSNIVAAGGSVFNQPLLLLPWLALYLLVNVFVSCLLVLVMILLQDAWFQVWGLFIYPRKFPSKF